MFLSNSFSFLPPLARVRTRVLKPLKILIGRVRTDYLTIGLRDVRKIVPGTILVMGMAALFSPGRLWAAACPVDNSSLFWSTHTTGVTQNIDGTNAWCTTTACTTRCTLSTFTSSHTLVFDGVNGRANAAINQNIWVSSIVLTVGYSTGVVSLGNFNLTVSSNFVVQSTMTVGNGLVIFDGTTAGGIIATKGMVFSSVTFNGVGGYWTMQDSMTVSSITFVNGTLNASTQAIKLNGSWMNKGGDFVTNLSTVTFAAAAGAPTIQSFGDNFANVVFNGAGSWVLLDSMTVTSTMTLTAGTITASTQAIAVGGSWYNTAGKIFKAPCSAHGVIRRL